MFSNVCGYAFKVQTPQFVHSHFIQDLRLYFYFYLEQSASRVDIK